MPRSKSKRKRKGLTGTPTVTRSRWKGRAPGKESDPYVAPPESATDRATRSDHSMANIHERERVSSAAAAREQAEIDARKAEREEQERRKSEEAQARHHAATLNNETVRANRSKRRGRQRRKHGPDVDEIRPYSAADES